MKSTRSARIAIDVSQMVYSGHGVARYTEELVRALLRLNSPHRFTLYAGAMRQHGFFRLRSRQKPWSKASWKLSYLPPKLSSLIWNHTAIPFSWVVDKQDLIHFSDWTHPQTKTLSVTTIHDLVFHHYPETVQPFVLKTQRARLKRAVKSRSYFIADSKSTKNDLVKIYQVDPQRITVVYPGVDNSFFPQESNFIKQVKTKYNLPDQYLLTLGTREPRKNLDRLIQAYVQLKTTQPDLPPLVIAGRYGWGKNEKIVDGVVVTGFIADHDLPAIYSGASVFIMPSLYEGFGFPVLEAMACGVPVVASNTSSLPEVVGKAGILVDPLSVQAIAGGIAQAINNSTKLSRQSLKQAQLFNWEKTAQATLEVYNQILTT